MKDSTVSYRMEALVLRMEAALDRLEALGHFGTVTPPTPEEKALEKKAIEDIIARWKWNFEEPKPVAD